MAKTKSSKDRVSPEQFGQMMQSIYESGYMDRKTMYKMTFIRGIMAGVGGVIGATIVVALLLWVLNFFDRVPLIGPLSDKLQQTVDVKKP